jgi:hypothetical protein
VRHEAVHVLGIRLPARGVVLHLLVGSARVLVVRAHVVDEHEAVHAFAVREEIADAPFLAQAAEELEIALVELRLVIAWRVGLDQAFVDGEVVAGQQFVQHFGNGLVLEDLAVGGQRGKVQPRAQREPVPDVAALFAPHGGVGDQRVDLAHARADVIDRCTDSARNELPRAVQLDVAGDLAADEAVEVEVGGPARPEVQGIGRLQKQFVFEQCVQALMARKARRLQRRPARDHGDRRALYGQGMRHPFPSI